MRNIFHALVIVVVASFLPPLQAYGLDDIKYDFENGDQDWKIPDWAYYQKDYKAESSEVSADLASSGKQSLKVVCDFPGTVWAAALVEVEKDYDFFGYKSISVDVYLPKAAPKDLILARMILTVGDGWLFTEMKTPQLLERGRWITITAKLDPYEMATSDWRGRAEKRLFNYIHKIKKIAVRIEYDAAPPFRIGPAYHGPVYIDNLVVKPWPDGVPPAGVYTSGVATMAEPQKTAK